MQMQPWMWFQLVLFLLLHLHLSQWQYLLRSSGRPERQETWVGTVGWRSGSWNAWGNDTMELESVSLDLRWSDNGDYMMSPMQLENTWSKVLATSPEFFDDLISSVKFSPDKKHTFCKMTLGGASVLVWKPDGLVDDSSLMSLDNEQGFEGMKEEIRNLEHCRTGAHHQPHRINCIESSEPSLALDP